VFASATEGGRDVARLYDDPSGKDTFVATPNYGRLCGDGFYNRASGFRYVFASATDGGSDVAKLYGSNAKDTFVGRSRYSKLRGSGFYNQATSFDQVHARGLRGGNDVVKLYDAVLEEGLTQQPVPADIDTIVWLYQFERIYQYNDPANGGDSVIDAVDQVFTAYWR
jgi:hypothetical protein